MNLLFYSPVDLRAGLGCERWHCDVTNSLKIQFNHSIRIITGNVGYKRWTDDDTRMQLSGIPYERLNYIVILSSLLPTINTMHKLYEAFMWADVVHFIHGFVGQDIVIAFLKLLTGKKVIVGHHAPIFHFSKFHNWYMKNVSRRLLNYFNGHMVLNRSDQKTLEKWGIKNVNFIPSGVRVEQFLSLKSIPHKGLSFLSLGRYDTPQKGFDLTVKAIAQFNSKYPENKAKFIFAGSGGASSFVQEYSRKHKNIIDLGFQKYEEIPKLYASTDVFLLSSREEPFGLILIEAWSSGVPVLATKTEGPLDMLKEGKNGWFIEEISEEGIFKGIEKVYNLWLENRKSFKMFEKNCRETGKIYSIDVTASRMNTSFFS